MLRIKLTFALAAALLVTSTARPAAPELDFFAKDQASQDIAVLKSDATQKEKADACMRLAVFGGADAVAPLAALLPDEKLSHMARYALETIPDPSVDTALREALGKVQGRLLAGVIGSLGVRKDAQAVDSLSKLLSDADPVVAQAAARALGKIGTSAAIQAIMAALPQASAANQLAFFEGAFRGTEALAAKGQRAEAAALYEKLRNLPGPHQARTAALRGAIVDGGPEGLALLQQSLRSADYLIFASAVRVAMERPGAQVAQVLAAAVAGAPADNQVLLFQALARTGDRAAVAPLASAAKAGDKTTRLAAIRALSELSFAPLGGATEPAQVPLDLLDDPDREIAQAAQDSLAALQGELVGQAVTTMFKSGTAAKRLTAIDLISRRHMTAFVPTLLEAANDSDAQVRQTALRKVGELGTPADLPKLFSLLTSLKDSRDLDAVEMAAGELCAKATDSEATADKLISQLAQAQPAQKSAFLRLLSGVGGAKALKTVRAAVDDPTPEVHATAIRAIGTWKTPDAAPELLALAQTAATPSDKILCLRGFLQMASQLEQQPAERLAMCRQALPLVQSNDEKKLFLATISGINSPATLPLILPHLDNPAIKEEAGAAAVAVAERLLRGKDSSSVASQLIAPLEKVSETTANVELEKRAKTALALAKKAAGK